MDNIIIVKTFMCLAAGVLIGFVHFGGLWLTVRRSFESRSGGVNYLAGFFVRSLISLTAIYLVSDGQLFGVAACIAGMILIRRVLTRKIGTVKDLP